MELQSSLIPRLTFKRAKKRIKTMFLKLYSEIFKY